MAVNVYVCLIVASCLTPAIIGGRHLVGGYGDIDPTREDVKEVAGFAVAQYNKESNDAYLYRGLTVVSARSQVLCHCNPAYDDMRGLLKNDLYRTVVAGTNYQLVMKIGKTHCQKNHVGDDVDVANSEVSEVLICTFVVYKTLPLPTSEFRLQRHNCHAE